MTQEELNYIKEAFSQIIDDIAGNPDWHEAARAIAEIEKRISLYKVEKSKEDASKVDKISLGARIAMLEEFKIFFDTLEGKGVGLEKIIEQTCPSVLDETVEKMYPMTTTPPTPIEVAAYYNAAQQKLRDAFKAGAEWMLNQLKNKKWV